MNPFFDQEDAIKKSGELFSRLTLFLEDTPEKRRLKSALFRDLATMTLLSGVAVDCRMESERLEKLGFGPVIIDGCEPGRQPKQLRL